jgi:hypothetical protein
MREKCVNFCKGSLEMKYVGANLPMSYIDAMDQWRLKQDDPQLTRGDALEYFVAKGLGIGLPSFEGRARPVSKAERDERGERLCQRYAELGTYAAVAREEGCSVGAVTRAIHCYTRRSRFIVTAS